MNDSTNNEAGPARSATPPNGPASLADLTAANRQQALAVARRHNFLGLPQVVVRGAVVAAGLALLAGASVVAANRADARVLPTPAVTVKPGPVKVPSGAVRCVGKLAVSVPVRTTTADSSGRHFAAVWIQYRVHGRAALVGYNHSDSPTVRVTGCIDPARIQGGHGPVYLIAEDAVDGRTRTVRVRFEGGRLSAGQVRL